ncbi:N-acetylmuramoyl-L-alanine amidase [Agaricicola taiwanensis]|uniref:N-acetylmuramoyl-L-alanine amidase n=1 Tax=Agaricicola taiwanensis TaxID=591372 RepID=A0A8J2W3N4_9RHOB|nr:N-acetylmuramoyl-L-alanine amidase [Agaricicola taiwanensis]GGE42205.1 N-acetylmuramoyl-L-alanine amidase [Agaricicola taiwanensis]
MSDALASPDCTVKASLAPSPNHDARPEGQEIDILLLHYTGMASAEAAIERLTSPDSKVSCHYLVHEDGCVVQMVPESRRAWHAGLGSWAGDSDINARSVGIEIVNPGHEFGYRPFPDAQIQSVILLGKDICARHGIPPERVLAHSDTAPRRKQDPGELFPWDALAVAGLGHWVEPAPISGGRFLSEGDRGEPVEALQAMLALYGYAMDINGHFDGATRSIVEAFQRHFRPARVDGIADGSTVTTLRNLLAELP